MSSNRDRRIDELINKSHDAALLAVDIYNKPATRFRSYGYIVLMTIAWTSLLHGIFEKNKVKYYYKYKGKYVYVDDERKAWELSTCVTKYFAGQNLGISKNLEFFIGIRNKIEHRFLPALDLKIVGECQALLLNYEKILTREFGEKYSLSDALSIPLQLLTVNPTWKSKIIEELQSREYKVVKNYIDKFQASLDESIGSSPEYSFKVFLIQKVGNHANSDDFSIEFIRYDPNNPEEMERYEHLVTFIKDKKVQVPVVNPGKLKPGEVSQKVSQALGIKFNHSSDHARCWRHFEVRPPKKSESPAFTNIVYCHYDVAHKDYVYTEEWVAFLINELSVPEKRLLVLGR